MNLFLGTLANRLITLVILPILVFISFCQIYSIYLHVDVFRGTPPAPKVLIDERPSFLSGNLHIRNSATAVRCELQGVGCAGALLRLINEDRRQHGAGPLTLDWAETHGSSGCVGSAGHSAHLAALVTDWRSFSSLAHDQFPGDICGNYNTAGENVGRGQGSKYTAMTETLNQMLAEGWVAGCVGSHACNLRNPQFHSIGIGFATANGYTYVTQDFTG